MSVSVAEGTINCDVGFQRKVKIIFKFNATLSFRTLAKWERWVRASSLRIWRQQLDLHRKRPQIPNKTTCIFPRCTMLTKRSSYQWLSESTSSSPTTNLSSVYLDRERWLWTFCHLPSLLSQTRVSSVCSECGTPLLPFTHNIHSTLQFTIMTERAKWVITTTTAMMTAMYKYNYNNDDADDN